MTWIYTDKELVQYHLALGGLWVVDATIAMYKARSQFVKNSSKSLIIKLTRERLFSDWTTVLKFTDNK